jgi:hypothetical protein
MVAVCPEQIVGLVTVSVGLGLTVTVEVFVALQLPTLALMVYTVVTIGLTLIVCMFCVVLQVYEMAAPAVRVAICPLQIVGEFTEIEPAEFTVTVAIVLTEQEPFAPVTV